MREDKKANELKNDDLIK